MATFSQMHHDVACVEFLLEPVTKADCPRAAALMEHSAVTNVDADFLRCEPQRKNVLIISWLFIIIDHNSRVAL